MRPASDMMKAPMPQLAKLVEAHNIEMARAAAAAMEQNFQETIEICSELLTSGTYPELEAQDRELARRCRAECRLMMATAMHYGERHYEDIMGVLGAALDSPPEVQKDVLFTMAVVQLSFGHKQEAQEFMNQSLDVISRLEGQGPAPTDGSLEAQRREAERFLAEIGQAS